MWTRCTNPRVKSFAIYGKAGITVCARWEDFSNFLADMGVRPLGTVLDRIRNDEGYEPSNCRWVSRQQSNVNRRCVTLVDGVPLKVAARTRKLNYPSVLRLMKSGLSFDQVAQRLEQNKRGWFRGGAGCS